MEVGSFPTPIKYSMGICRRKRDLENPVFPQARAVALNLLQNPQKSCPVTLFYPQKISPNMTGICPLFHTFSSSLASWGFVSRILGVASCMTIDHGLCATANLRQEFKCLTFLQTDSERYHNTARYINLCFAQKYHVPRWQSLIMPGINSRRCQLVL